MKPSSISYWTSYYRRACQLLILPGFLILIMPRISIADTTRFISEFTSIKNLECFEVSSPMTKYYDKRQLDANECSGFKGWKIFSVYDFEGNSWIDIAYGGKLWSTELLEKKQIQKNVGYRPHLRSEIVEWRVNKTGEPNVLMYRVHAQQQNKPEPFASRLFIFSLKENTPSFCGIAKTNEEARVIADKTKHCVALIPSLKNARDILKNNRAETGIYSGRATTSNAIFRNQHTSFGGAVGLPEISKKLEQYLTRYGNFISEYTAPGGWRLIGYYETEHSWLKLVRGRTIWDLRNVQSKVGQASAPLDRVQWRMTKDGIAKALIFRVMALDVEKHNTLISRLVVIGLTGNKPRYCGIAKTNIEAYAIADKSNSCTGILTIETLPK